MEKPALTQEQIEKIKAELLLEKAEKQELLKQMAADQDRYCLDKNELADQLDEASANVETSKLLRFRNRELLYLKKIDAALEKIANKTYGTCDECGNYINAERLNARPTADLCIACKEESEIAEKNNVFQKKSKSLGATISELSQPH